MAQDPRVDQREINKIREIRHGLLAMERELDYPRWQCPCKQTHVTREHEKLMRGIQAALKATERLIIHYIDRDTII